MTFYISSSVDVLTPFDVVLLIFDRGYTLLVKFGIGTFNLNRDGSLTHDIGATLHPCTGYGFCEIVGKGKAIGN